MIEVDDRRRKMMRLNNSGGNLRQMLIDSAPFLSELLYTAVPQRAASGTTATFTRATTATFTDFEGVLRTAPAGCARFVGARFVRNLVPVSENFNAASVTRVNGTASGKVFTATSSGAFLYQLQSAVVSGNSYILSAKVSLAAGSKATSMWINGTPASPNPKEKAVTITTTPQVVSLSFTAAASDTINAGFGGYTGTFDSGQVLTIDEWQLEDVTGRTDQTTPSEYVSVGVLSAPYHGAGVDGVKYFNTDLDGNALPTAYTYDAVTLNGQSGTYVSTSDSVANSITGPKDLLVKVNFSSLATADYQTFIDKITAGALGYTFTTDTASSGKLAFFHTTGGSTLRTVISTATMASVGMVAGTTYWLKLSHDTATGNVAFHFAANSVAVPTAWTQIGTTVSSTAGSDLDTSASVGVGGRQATGGGNPFSGKIYRAQIYNGINGALAVDFDASRYEGGTTLTGSTGETWTLQGNAIIHPTNNPMLGYLAESAATNLQRRSRFDQKGSAGVTAGWMEESSDAVNTNVVVTLNSGPSIDGTTKAAKIANNADNARHATYYYDPVVTSVPISANTTYAVSFDLWPGTATRARVDWVIGGWTSGCYADVDMSTGVIYATGTYGTGTYTASTISPITGGGYRVTLAGKVDAATTVGYATVSVLKSDGTLSYVGGGEYLYADRAQVEAGSMSTSFIETTSAAVTRNADVLTYTGGDIANIKTLAATFQRAVGVSNSGYIAALCDGTLNELSASYLNTATQHRFNGLDGGVGQWDTISSNAYSPGATSKVAWSMATNDIKMDKDGTAQTQDTVATIPTINQLQVGHVTGSFQLNGNVGGIYGWTRNLSQSELGAIDR